MREANEHGIMSGNLCKAKSLFPKENINVHGITSGNLFFKG